MHELTGGITRDTLMDFVEKGIISSFSIGFNNVKYTMKNGIKYISYGEILECSIVTIPANPDATMINYSKSFSEENNIPFAVFNHPWNKEEANARWKKFTESEEKPNEFYSKGFLITKNLEEEISFNDFTSQIVDVIDGIPHIIPKAILQISRKIRENDCEFNTLSKESIDYLKQNIAELCEKGGIKNPFSENLVEIITKAENIRDMKEILQYNLGFSSNESEAIITWVKKQSEPEKELQEMLKKYLDIKNNDITDENNKSFSETESMEKSAKDSKNNSENNVSYDELIAINKQLSAEINFIKEKNHRLKQYIKI
jgi:hypothetical protein